MSLLSWLRERRDKNRALRMLHGVLRRPYYLILQSLFPRGIKSLLSSGDWFRFNPVFGGMALDRYEPDLMATFGGYLSPGMLVIDIGAHVGIYSLVASRRVGAGGKVVAVEASPSNVAMLTMHLRMNDCSNVEVVNAAAGDRPSTVEFSYYLDPLSPSAFANSIAYDNGPIRTKINMVTVDDLCGDQVPGLIKIDVEGAELLVLKGARQTLERHAAIVLVAIHPEAMAALGHKPRELVEYMHERGYSASTLAGLPAVDPGFEEIVCVPNTQNRQAVKTPAVATSPDAV